jgi:hypothetical protein
LRARLRALFSQFRLSAALSENPAKPARRRVSSPGPKTKRRKPDHSEIAERAYFIHLEEDECDELGNWLRAEHELTAA